MSGAESEDSELAEGGAETRLRFAEAQLGAITRMCSVIVITIVNLYQMTRYTTGNTTTVRHTYRQCRETI